jgi:hypothetical protein
MAWLTSWLSVIHLIGLALGLGGATVKLMLLLKCRKDSAFVPSYIAVARRITHMIITGIALLVVSGVVWLVFGYPFTTLLIVKLVMVAAILAMGPVIDNVIEPKFRALAPAPGESATPAFLEVQQRYLVMETLATGLFYVIVIEWVTR